MIEAFNRMLERETEREGALQDAKTELEYSEVELRRFNEHLEQLVDERTRGLASKNAALEREIDTRVVAPRASATRRSPASPTRSRAFPKASRFGIAMTVW